jgi:hypothetical protein
VGLLRLAQDGAVKSDHPELPEHQLPGRSEDAARDPVPERQTPDTSSSHILSRQAHLSSHIMAPHPFLALSLNLPNSGAQASESCDIHRIPNAPQTPQLRTAHHRPDCNIVTPCSPPPSLHLHLCLCSSLTHTELPLMEHGPYYCFFHACLC